KTTAIAAAMEGQGLVVACDVRRRRIDLLRTTIDSTAAPNVRIVQADPLRPLPFSDRFDLVVLDAPCSGLGTLRRDPDIRWRRSPDELDDLAGRQLEMLQRAAAVLRPGGRIIYATCSSEPEEDEDVVTAFLSSHPDFRLAPERVPSGLAAFTTPGGHFRTLPF